MASTRVVSGGRMRVQAAWTANRHAHDLHEMMVIHGGRIEAEVGEETVAAGPGDVLVYPPRVPHRERAAERNGCEFTFLLFATELAVPALRSHDAEGRMRQMAAWVLAELDATAPPRALADGLVDCILRAHARPPGGREDSLAASVRAFLAGRLASPIEVEDMARHARMSRAHFMRRFKAETGRTPMQELRRLRLERARELIASSDLPLREVARRAGLGDEHQLSHVFRRELGAPPGYFRAER